MPYLSFLGEPKVFTQSHGRWVNSSVPLGPRFQPYGNIWYGNSVWSKNMSFLLVALKISTVYASNWLKYCRGLEQVVGCPTLGSTFVWSSRSSFPQWLMAVGKLLFV